MPDRPPITNPESAATRERLLDAAERLFAERGFRSASVRDITRESSCNIAAVNYHFGGKSNLYREVFLRRLRAVRQARIEGIERALSHAGSGATLELLLQEFTAAFVSPFEDAVGRLWMLLIAQELIDPQLPPATFQAEMLDPLERVFTAALMEICVGLEREDAALCLHSLMGQLVHMVHLQRMHHEAGSERWDLTELVAHTVRFSAAGIRALESVAA